LYREKIPWLRESLQEELLNATPESRIVRTLPGTIGPLSVKQGDPHSSFADKQGGTA
jgi:hypothetical protein